MTFSFNNCTCALSYALIAQELASNGKTTDQALSQLKKGYAAANRTVATNGDLQTMTYFYGKSYHLPQASDQKKKIRK
jgi:hypothetical protein